MKGKKQMVPHVRTGEQNTSTHHRKPVAQGGRHYQPKNGLSNTIKLTKKQHEAWHTLFDGLETPEQICAKCNLLLDPDYYFVVRRAK